MDSLRIRNRRTWFRYSDKTGGDAIAFLQWFCGKSFQEAVKCLLAAKMATTVTGKPQNVGVFLDLYRRYIADALHHDVSQRGSNDQHPLKDILKRSIL